MNRSNPSHRRRSSRKPAGRRKQPASGRRLWRWVGAAAAVVLVAGAGYLLFLDQRVTTHFEGKRWSVPAHVYARPLELFPGRRLRASNLGLELKAAGYRAVDSADDPGEYARQGTVFRVNTRAFNFWDTVEPARRLEVRLDGRQVAAVRALDTGQELPLARLDPALLGRLDAGHREDRVLVRLDEVPRTLVAALIATEDQRFARHPGIDLVGIARAAWANLRAGRIVQGGSTLTQQLVKNFYLDSQRTLGRKLNEAAMALLLELHYSKAEILEAYLNEVYLGQDGERSVHGFGLASRFYFDRPLGELTLAQQALLVGLVRGPGHYAPRRHPERARARRDLVLRRMAESAMVPAEAARQARGESLDVVERPPDTGGRYPAFLDLVRRHLQRDYRPEDLVSEGLRVFTTLAPHVQYAAEAAVSQGARQLGQDLQGAAVVVGVDGGEVRALVGGRDPDFPGFNRALDARRPIGSLVKPAVYLTALSRPGHYGLGTLIPDQPVSLQDRSGETWSPDNYDHRSHGQVPLWQALAQSYNQATVRLGLDLGLRAVVDTLERLGAPVPGHIYPSLLLGSLPMSPLDVAQMYETLAAEGYRMPLRSVRAVTNGRGEPLNRYPLQVRRVFEPAEVHLLTHGLRLVVTEGTGRALGQRLDGRLAVAGKTGTTDDSRDSWFAGFTGDTLGVVWLGRDDNGRTGLTGSSGALPVWSELFAALDPRPLAEAAPAGVEPVWVDAATGLRAAAHCEAARKLPYIEGSGPRERADCVGGGLVERAAGWLRGLLR